MKIIFTFLGALVTMCALDMLWLGYLAKPYYEKLLNPVINLKFNLWPGVAFYIFYMIGIYLFVLMPGIEARSLAKTMSLAAVFGFMCYMTYDLTNMATVKDWPLMVVIMDVLWGMAITTVTAMVGYKLYFYML